MVVGFGDSILGSKPNVFFNIKGIIKARSCKAFNTLINIVNALNNTVGLEIVDKRSCFVSVFIGYNKLSFAVCLDLKLSVLVNISVSVTGNGYGLSPCGDKRCYSFSIK